MSDWTLYKGLVLCLLTCSYVVGEMAHFLIMVTSKRVAKDIGFGTLKCYTNESVENNNGTRDCNVAQTRERCEIDSFCVWEYSGQGIEFQVLAGPSFIVIFTVSGVVMGLLADRIHRPRLLSLSTAIFSTAQICMAAASQYWQLVLLRMAIAMGEACCRPAACSLIAELFSPASRGMANGIFSWGIYIGYGLAFIFGIYVVDANILGYGWRAAYVLSGAPGLIAAILLLFVPDPRDSPLNSTPPISSKNASYNSLDTSSMPQPSNSSTPSASLISQEVAPENLETKPIYNTPSTPEPLSYSRQVLSSFLQPAMLLLFLAAAVRHTSSYSWANNNVNYFLEYHEGKEIGYWFTICSIVGGSVGVFGGGYLSDLLVRKLGLYSRLWLLGGFTLLATPFAVFTLYLEPPYAFVTLMGYYLFAETWFAILFTVIVEIVPSTVRAVCIGVFLFLMNNIGGNLPIVVDPISKIIGLRSALYIFWPGLVATSSLLFVIASIPHWRNNRNNSRLGQ